MEKSTFIFLTIVSFGCQPKETEVKMLQFNIWQEGIVVPGWSMAYRP